MKEAMEEAASQVSHDMERYLTSLGIIASISPLLGLLGTVVGMIATFQMITLFGTGDPRMMAGGISTALVTTVLGLCVAIPTVFLHTLVSSRARRLTQILQEESAGMLAELAEGKQNAAVDALFAAYFKEGRDIGDIEVLSDIADGIGMDASVVMRLLQSDADIEDIRARDAHSREMGINSVPTFIVDGKHAVPGAQPPDLWARVIAEVQDTAAQ